MSRPNAHCLFRSLLSEAVRKRELGSGRCMLSSMLAQGEAYEASPGTWPTSNANESVVNLVAEDLLSGSSFATNHARAAGFRTCASTHPAEGLGQPKSAKSRPPYASASRRHACGNRNPRVFLPRSTADSLTGASSQRLVTSCSRSLKLDRPLDAPRLRSAERGLSSQ